MDQALRLSPQAMGLKPDYSEAHFQSGQRTGGDRPKAEAIDFLSAGH